MNAEKLLRDIEDFQKLSNSDRKEIVGAMYTMLGKIEVDFGYNSRTFKACLAGIKAIDALHHLAK